VNYFSLLLHSGTADICKKTFLIWREQDGIAAEGNTLNSEATHKQLCILFFRL